MKRIIQRFLISATFFAIAKTPLSAQAGKEYTFIGLNPSVTVETYYQKGELDVNIFPVVYQKTLTRRFDIRLNSIVNLGIRNNGNEISHFGLEAGLPIFLKKKESIDEIPHGFFVAPVSSLTRNRIEEHNNLGLWIEPGYNLLFDNRFSMSFGVQLGGTYFAYDNGQKKWGNHFGVKVIIGKWL